MKKIIFKAIIFISILLIILAILTKIFIPKNNTRRSGIHKSKVLQTGVLAEPENTLDVILVGNSEAYTSFIPLEAWHKYGYTSYVCGTPGQKLPSICSIIYDVLKKQNPKIVMLEADTIYKRVPLVTPVEQIASKVFPIFEYHDRWKKLRIEDFHKKSEYKKIQASKGFYFSNEIQSRKNEEYMNESEETQRIPKSNKIYVKTIKKYCESKGIEFIIYSTPSIMNWSMEKHNGVENLAKELGVEYLDMNLLNNEINIDWKKDSRDKGDHLNYTGSLKTTKFLGEYLNKKGLPDHRADEKYESWNKYYNKYIKEIKDKNNVIDTK